MSYSLAADSYLPSSPLKSADSGYAPLDATDSIAIWQASPSEPVSTPQKYYDFDIEELSEDNVDDSCYAQVLHPYELEEVDTPVANRSHVNQFIEIDEEDGGQDTPESGSTALAHRLRRIRWQPASRPSDSIRSSPVPSNPRKRVRSEALDTDTDSDGFDSSYTRSEPPRMRRRVHGPGIAPAMATPSAVSDASTPRATTTTPTSDELMDVDEQAA
ncbi:hypothetical protein M436DRAFT_83253 [Aureobasidium namibiae CBS 147.97]|uniref:Uncharacterized protein n=1 Tax=Aureobasidium namibiae CBS 147.97 TaxID=1043004 RepID=A0A074WF53_9PEZI